MRCEWCRYYPLVMWLMECLVNAGVMQETMYPVDGIVCEEKIKWYGQDEIGPSVLVDVVIKSGVAHDLCLKPGEGKEGHHGECIQACPYLEHDLVWQEPWMSHHVVVEYKLV